MSHRNARTNEFGRLLIAERVLASHKPSEVAKQLGVSRQTVHKWVRRYQIPAPRTRPNGCATGPGDERCSNSAVPGGRGASELARCPRLRGHDPARPPLPP
ncbi:MAG TPA: leucine zipper domain-containing protein [Mycobacteriales bacterium]|nr:leucine zipper domain-containing protein [Mycobacteriales bacterium]